MPRPVAVSLRGLHDGLAGLERLLRCCAGSPRVRLVAVGAALALVAGCDRTGASETATLFESLTPAQTGVRFVNELPEAPEFNILNYLYYYNGGWIPDSP